jgi:alcohol dehydrogenase class IV
MMSRFPERQWDWPTGVATYRPPVGLRAVVSGLGCVADRLGRELRAQAVERPMVVCGENVARSPVLDLVISAAGHTSGVYSGSRPHVPWETVDRGAAMAREVNADGIIALGGSSAVDCAAGIGVLLNRRLDSVAELEPISFGSTGSGDSPSPGRVAILTVTGTLSFAEMFGFFGMKQSSRKRAYADDGDVVRTVFLDGEVAKLTPSRVWLETGLKALEDAIFAFAPGPEPFLDPLLRESIAAIVELGESGFVPVRTLRACGREACR